METVTSKDGTTLAFDRLGQGPPVVLVCGGSVDRMADAAIAQELSSDFTVLNYDRRGRGDSGDTLPYAIEREVEDIEAVIGAAGGSAHLWGSSSGAVLALIATASGAPVTKLALWEPPFILDENARPPADQVEQYERMIAEGPSRRRGRVLHVEGRRDAPGVRRRRADAAVVGRAGGDRPHARVRRPHHGRLLDPDRDRRRRSRPRPSCSPAGPTCRSCASRPRPWRTRSPTDRSGSSTVRGTTSTRRSSHRR